MMPTWIVLMAVVGIAGGCTIAAVAIWSENRRKEREEFHRSETHRRMLEGSAEAAETVYRLIQEQERERERRQHEARVLGLRMGGWINTAVGIGLGVFLYFLAPDQPIWLVGLLPLLVGLVLIVFGAQAGAQSSMARSGR